MDKEQELKELREEMLEYWHDEYSYPMDAYCSDKITELLCSDEALARKFFTECFHSGYLRMPPIAIWICLHGANSMRCWSIPNYGNMTRIFATGRKSI